MKRQQREEDKNVKAILPLCCNLYMMLAALGPCQKYSEAVYGNQRGKYLASRGLIRGRWMIDRAISGESLSLIITA